MKKLFYSILVVGALAAATSCSTKTSDSEAMDEGAAIKAKIENCTDSDSLAIYVQQAKDYATKLAKEGNDSAAQAYLQEVAPAVKAKDPSQAGFFETLEAKADSTLSEVAAEADSLKDKTAADAKAAAADAKEKVENAAENAKEKVANAAETAKEKTADAAQNAADKVKNALGK